MSKIDAPEMKSFTKNWHDGPYEAISCSHPELSMVGKNILITGGGTGIGKATAIALQSSKTDVIEAATRDRKVLYEIADIAIPAQANKAFANIAEQVGKIDILIDNAGVICPPDAIADAPFSHINKVIESNILTTFNATQVFLPYMSSEPILINITACLIHIEPMPSMELFAAAEAAQSLVVDYIEVENPQLHVVHLHPGMVTTEIGGPDSDVNSIDRGELPAQVAV
ncbi:hypothetical protein FSHL1_002872 [Fusarium sambucinum]